eukprot:2240484-Prymnesium_polylepis.1
MPDSRHVSERSERTESTTGAMLTLRFPGCHGFRLASLNPCEAASTERCRLECPITSLTQRKVTASLPTQSQPAATPPPRSPE